MTRTQTKIRREEVIQWIIKISLSSVLTAVPRLPSVLKIRNSSIQRDTPMSPNAVLHADRREKQSGMEAVDTEPGARCSPRYVPSAARILKYPLNHAVIGQSTVAIATAAKSDKLDNPG